MAMRKAMQLSVLAILLAGCWLDLEPNFDGPPTLVDGIDTGQKEYVIELSPAAKRTVELTVARNRAMTSDCRGYAYGPIINGPRPFNAEIGKDNLTDFPLPDLVRVVDSNGLTVIPPTASVSARADFTQVSKISFEALKPGTALVGMGIVCYPGDVFGGVAAYTSSNVGLIRLVVK
jgi:hypothetical protein